MLPLAGREHLYLEVLYSHSSGIVLSKWKNKAPVSWHT